MGCLDEDATGFCADVVANVKGEWTWRAWALENVREMFDEEHCGCSGKDKTFDGRVIGKDANNIVRGRLWWGKERSKVRGEEQNEGERC